MISNLNDLKKRQEMMNTIMENATVSITLMDYNGYFTFFNKQAEKNLMFSREEISTKSIVELFPAEGPETLRCIRQIFEDKQPVTLEVTYHHHGKDFHYEISRSPLFDENGAVYNVMSIARNITDIKRQQELLNIQHKIDSISNISNDLNSSLDMVFQYLYMIDWIDCGGIYLLNDQKDAFELIYSTGLSEAFIQTFNKFSLESPHSRILIDKVPRYITHFNFLQETHHRLLNEGILSGAIIPLIYEDQVIGSLNLASKTSENVDEIDKKIIESIAYRLAQLILLVKTRMELDKSNSELFIKLHELSVKQQMLIQKSRLESLGELAAGLAHEINQPLSVISLVMENIHYKLGMKIATEEYLTGKFNTIGQNISKIRELIDHFRIFSRDQGTIMYEKVDVNEAIRNALSMIGSQLRNHYFKLIIDLDDTIGYTIGNPSRFEQVILNLVSNARDAIEEKELTVNSVSVSKEIRISTRISGEEIKIMVRDNGTGISEANLEKIFNPFFTTKGAGHGTGLGLPIVYGIIREMRGEISVRSEEGSFTEITITLPHYKNN